MSLNWQWKEDYMGHAVMENGNTVNLYNGNALVIALYETEETYSLAWFAGDKEHMKNMLGLNKKYSTENVFKDFGVTELFLNINARNSKQLAELIIKSGTEITIHMQDIPF